MSVRRPTCIDSFSAGVEDRELVVGAAAGLGAYSFTPGEKPLTAMTRGPGLHADPGSRLFGAGSAFLAVHRAVLCLPTPASSSVGWRRATLARRRPCCVHRRFHHSLRRPARPRDCSSLATFQNTVRVVGGIVIIVMGLVLTDVVRGPFARERRLFPTLPKVTGVARPYIVGIAFGAGWSPCVGPLLAAALTIAARSQEVAGRALLTAYAADQRTLPPRRFRPSLLHRRSGPAPTRRSTLERIAACSSSA